MEEIVKRLADNRRAELQKDTSSWFNGHGYFPLHTFKFNYDFEGWKINLVSEWRVSELTRSEKNAGNPFSDVMLWSVSAIRPGLDPAYDFDIEKESGLKSVFDNKSVSVKCRSEVLKGQIEELESLKDWYISSPYPLDNSFSCRSSDDGTNLSTTFNTEFKPEEKAEKALELIQQLCSKINQMIKEELHTTKAKANGG